MKIELEIEEDENNLPIHTLLIDGKEIAHIQDLSECPEDAHIGRDLIDGNDIIKYLQLGYNAGVKGEEFTVDIIRN